MPVDLTLLCKTFEQVTAEAEEAKAAAAQAIDEANKFKQELEQAKAHIATIEIRLHAAQLEVEAVKASEERALSQVTHIIHLLHFLIEYTFCLALIMFFFKVLQFCILYLAKVFAFVSSYGLIVYV